ncbi:hypothetical protein [Sphingomonas cavernae]|nr:hypothetical protein [Sphingomonas cavernae]
MITMLKSELFQRFAGGFVVGAIAIVAVQPADAWPFLEAIKAAAGIA